MNVQGIILEETKGNTNFSKEENLQKIESLVGKSIKRQVESAITKSQKELKADYLGFEKALKQNRLDQDPSLDWEKVFLDVPIKVKVRCKIRTSGLQT